LEGDEGGFAHRLALSEQALAEPPPAAAPHPTFMPLGLAGLVPALPGPQAAPAEAARLGTEPTFAIVAPATTLPAAMPEGVTMAAALAAPAAPTTADAATAPPPAPPTEPDVPSAMRPQTPAERAAVRAEARPATVVEAPAIVVETQQPLDGEPVPAAMPPEPPAPVATPPKPARAALPAAREEPVARPGVEADTAPLLVSGLPSLGTATAEAGRAGAPRVAVEAPSDTTRPAEEQRAAVPAEPVLPPPLPPTLAAAAPPPLGAEARPARGDTPPGLDARAATPAPALGEGQTPGLLSLSEAPSPAASVPAEAPRDVAGPPARQVAPIAIALAFAPTSGQGFTLALDPPELGRVEIHVTREGETHSVALTAERPETLALLQRDRAELDRSLAQAGLSLSGGVSFSLTGGQAGGDGQPARDGRRGAPRDDQAASPALEAAPRALRGLLDLHA